jgi:hypothetical protein
MERLRMRGHAREVADVSLPYFSAKGKVIP